MPSTSTTPSAIAPGLRARLASASPRAPALARRRRAAARRGRGRAARGAATRGVGDRAGAPRELGLAPRRRRPARRASASARGVLRGARAPCGACVRAASAGARRSARLGARRLGARRLGGRLVEDRVDQLGLAKPPEALEAELVGDRVQVGERACLQLGALEYGHVMFLLSWWRAVGVPPRWTAAGTRDGLSLAARRRLAPSSAVARAAVVADFLGEREIPAGLGSPRERRADREEVGRGGDVVHAEDVRAVLDAVGERGERAGEALARRRAPVSAPMKSLREIAISSGRPSSCRRPTSREQPDRLRGRLGEVRARDRGSAARARRPPRARAPCARAGRRAPRR